MEKKGISLRKIAQLCHSLEHIQADGRKTHVEAYDFEHPDSQALDMPEGYYKKFNERFLALFHRLGIDASNLRYSQGDYSFSVQNAKQLALPLSQLTAKKDGKRLRNGDIRSLASVSFILALETIVTETMREAGKTEAEIAVQLFKFYAATDYPEYVSLPECKRKLGAEIDRFFWNKVHNRGLTRSDRKFIMETIQREVIEYLQEYLGDMAEMVDYFVEARDDEISDGGVWAQQDDEYGEYVSADIDLQGLLADDEEFSALRQEYESSLAEGNLSKEPEREKMRRKIKKRTREIGKEIALKRNLDLDKLLNFDKMDADKSKSSQELYDEYQEETNP